METGAFRIVVRADASEAIGAGHVMRCLSLANALNRHARVQFATFNLPAPLAHRVEAAGCDVLPLRAPAVPDADAAAIRSSMARSGRADCDCLIVDHYGLDAAWCEAMRGLARCIVGAATQVIGNAARIANKQPVLSMRWMVARPGRLSYV